MSIQLAEQYEENEQYAQAYDVYKKLYDKNPKDLSILERLGHVSMVLNNKEEAAEYYSKILDFDATNTLAYEQLMDIYVEIDRYKYYIYRGNLHIVEHKLEHAINDYKKAVNSAQNDPEMLQARFVLGSLFEQEGNNVKAIDEYLKVIEYENTHEEVYTRLANLYVKEGAIASAVDVLQRAINSGFESTSVKENLADLYLKNGNPDKAFEITNDELTKVRCLLEMGKKTEAIEKLDAIESQYDHIPQFHSLKAQYYYTISEFEKALNCIDDFDKAEKNSPLTYQMRALVYEELKQDYNAHINWGKYNLVRGNKDIAINEFLNAYQLKSDDLDLLNTLAMLLEEVNDRNHAMEFYEKIAKLDETDKKSLQKLAEFRDSIGDYSAKADYLLKLYKLDKKNYTLVRELGETYERIHNKPAAIECYEKYLEIGKADTNYNYAKVRQKLDKLAHTDVTEGEGLLDKIIGWFNKR